MRAGERRIAEASDWFARMRGPDAEAFRARFETWRSLPENARAYAEIERVWAASGMARARSAAQRAGPARAAWPRYALAASVGLIAIVLALLLLGNGGSAVPAGRSGIYASRIGEIRTIALADGSRITLDTASRIAVRYSARQRRIGLLAGRARFAVAHDEARPFIVMAGRRAVVARGTVFDVRLAGPAMEVTLLEGQVDVEHVAGLMHTRLARLQPGQRIVVRGADPSPLMPAAAVREGIWTQGLLPAQATPLGEVIAEANRYSSDKIVLADPALARLRVSGAFRPGDAEALAAKLSAALGLAAATRGDGSVVISRKGSRAPAQVF